MFIAHCMEYKCLFSLLFADAFLKIFRHGDRTPIHLIPNDKNTEDDWPEGLGQLTTVSTHIFSG